MIITKGLGSNMVLTQGYGDAMYLYLVMLYTLLSSEYVSILLGST